MRFGRDALKTQCVPSFGGRKGRRQHHTPPTDNGDDVWDATPPELLPAVFSSRKKEEMKKKQIKRRAMKRTRLHLHQLLLPH
jgi:hypothetical protein